MPSLGPTDQQIENQAKIFLADVDLESTPERLQFMTELVLYKAQHKLNRGDPDIFIKVFGTKHVDIYRVFGSSLILKQAIGHLN